MLKSLLHHKLQIAVVIILVFGFVVIRSFEDVLFYDPFLDYFKGDYFLVPIPEIAGLKLFFHLLFRYFLNTILSLGIIYAIFKKKELVRFSAILYGSFFIILILALFIWITYFPHSKLTIFYIRRFLIQPLFLLLFLPAFYFQEKASAKNNIS